MNKSLSLKLKSCQCSVSVCYEMNLVRRSCVAGCCLQMFERGNGPRKLLLITSTSTVGKESVLTLIPWEYRQARKVKRKVALLKPTDCH